MNRFFVPSFVVAAAAFAPTSAAAPAATAIATTGELQASEPVCEALIDYWGYDAFLRTSFVELGLGAGATVGSRVRAPASFYSSHRPATGLVADVADTGWQAPSGDFVLRGAPEETWVLDVAGVARANSRNQGRMSIPGDWLHVECNETSATAVWQTRFEDEPVRVTHVFEVPHDRRYVIVRVILENRTEVPLDDVYYLRNVDPDNDQALHGSYYTINAIRAQPRPGHPLAVVEATQPLAAGYGSESRLALLANDRRARVSHGGFRNRSARAVWHGDGVDHVGWRRADRAISLAFRTRLRAHETAELSFAYAVGDDVDAAVEALGGRWAPAPRKPTVPAGNRQLTTRPSRSARR